MNCIASMSYYGLPSISWEFLGELWQGWELFISSLRRQCMNGKWSIHRAAFSASMDLNGAWFLELVPPALTAFIPVVFGPVQLLTYPLILTFVASSCLISIYLCIRRPGITLLMILILWPLSLVTETYVLFALDFMVARFGLTYRFGREPVFNATLALLPLLYLVCVLIVEAVAYWQRRHGGEKDEDLRGAWLLGVVMAVPAVAVPPVIAHALAPVIWLPPDVIKVLEPGWLDMLVSLPF